jgi:predicted dehydrogenase
MNAVSHRYRAGIIGLGFIGAGDHPAAERLGQRVADLDGTHREALANHPRVQLVTGASRDPGRRERFQQSTAAQVHADWREMLAKERLDIVSVATMTPDHAGQTIGCAKAGVKAVYCEKPIAATIPEAEQMIAACRKTGTLLVINHNRRFQPNFRKLAEFVAAGKLGELPGARLQWGTGRLGNVGTHFIDSIRLLTRQEVRAVSATLDLTGRSDCRGAEFRDPGGWALLKMAGGWTTTIIAPDDSRDPGEIVISGSLGRAIVAGNAVRIEFWNGTQDEWPATANGKTSMDVAIAEVVAALDGDGAVVSTGEDALADLEIILACHASHARNGGWIELPLAGADRRLRLNCG